MTDKKKPIASPCISVCLLDKNDMCVGCYRTADEITEWMSGSDEQRLAILEKSAQRMKADQTHGLL